MKDNIGAEMVRLDSQIFMDININWLAEFVSANVNTIIKEKSAEMAALMAKLAMKRESKIIGSSIQRLPI